MRVLMVAGSYPSDEHPARGAFVREQARAIAGSHDVVVACLDGPDPSLDDRADLVEERRDGLRTLRVRYRPVGPVRGRNDHTGLRRVVERLEEEGARPDVVHAHFFYVAERIAATARDRGIPLVVSEHSSAFARGLATRRERRAARAAFGAAALVCPVSEYLREAIRGAGFDPPMRVVPNPVDADAFAAPRSHPPGDPPTVVTVAGLNRLKGVDLLVRAVARTDARLVVVGDGEERERLHALAADCGIAGRVEFRGALPKPDLAAALAEADLFCLPSLGETQGVAFIDAMASGLPIVGTRVGGVPETVGEHAGELVAPGDLDALTAALQRTLARLPEFDRAAIRDRTLARFGYDAVGATWTEVYESVATG